MNNKKIFLRLKNGVEIAAFYKKDAATSYSIFLSFQHDVFRLHSYYLDGDDVFDENNYTDESMIEIGDFNSFMELVNTKFPGINIPV